MKWLIAVLMSLSMVTVTIGQEVKNAKGSKQELSQKRKVERKARADSLYQLTGRILADKEFVLEAERIRNNQGVQVTVSTLLNFISVDSNHVVIQIGSMQRTGRNGVGGITEEGRITSWKLTSDDKRSNYSVFMTVQTKINVYDINLNVDYSGNADAYLSGLRAGKLIFSGRILPRENSDVFKGMSH